MRWWQRYEIHGEASFSMKPKKYTGEFKIEVVKYMHDNHFSLEEASAIFGILGSSTLFNWERIYFKEGEKGLLVDRPGRLRKEVMKKDKIESEINSLNKKSKENLILQVQHLKAEVDYLKKSIALKEEKMGLQTKKKHR
jgi:transposase